MVTERQQDGNFATDCEIHDESNVRSKDRKRAKSLTLMLGMNETTDQLAMANSVHWHGHVLRREDGHVVKMEVDFKGEGRRKKVS